MNRKIQTEMLKISELLGDKGIANQRILQSLIILKKSIIRNENFDFDFDRLIKISHKGEALTASQVCAMMAIPPIKVNQVGAALRTRFERKSVRKYNGIRKCYIIE